MTGYHDANGIFVRKCARSAGKIRQACVIIAWIVFAMAMPAHGTPAPKTYARSSQNGGTAVISNLSGNTCPYSGGTYVSGTDISVNMYVENSWFSTVHTCEPMLGTYTVANDAADVSTGSGSGNALTTNSSGAWGSSSGPGWLGFDTDELEDDGTTGVLQVQLQPVGLPTFQSTSVGVGTVTTYNKAYVAYNPWEDFGPTMEADVTGDMQDMNHSVGESGTDTAAEVVNEIPAYTVFYIDTEGDTDANGGPCFADCEWPNPVTPIPVFVWVYTSAVSGAIANKACPAYNLVFVDACWSAGDYGNPGVINTGMANAFGDYLTNDDRAYLGYTNVAWDTQDQVDDVEDIFNLLEQHYTVQGAVSAAWQMDQAQYATEQQVCGDQNMKLSGMYGLQP